MTSQKSKVSCDRRSLLKGAAIAGLGSVLASAESGQGKDSPQAALLPTIKLGPHSVTRLIVGGNPIYGHSHFNKMLSRYFTDWHTPDRVMALLRRCQEVGINTWQNSYLERTLSDLERFRQEGGTLNWLCLGKGDWDRFPERIRRCRQTQANRHRSARANRRTAVSRKETYDSYRPSQADSRSWSASWPVGSQPGAH